MILSVEDPPQSEVEQIVVTTLYVRLALVTVSVEEAVDIKVSV